MTTIPFQKVKLPKTTHDFPPRFAFSLHKCGSTLLVNLVEDVLRDAKIPCVNPARELFALGFSGAVWGADPGFLDIVKPGYVYTGFRDFPPTLTTQTLAATKSVLMVRDPRDALVSAYFSFGPGGSHKPPRKNEAAAKRMQDRRAEEKSLTIDEWVLGRMAHFNAKFIAYAPYLDMPQLQLFRYEDVFFDKLSFARALFAHLNFDIDDAILVRAAAKHNVVPDTERPQLHIRKGLPGDHKEKLLPETIAALNVGLKTAMDIYGYTEAA